jgi:hypothetical protein
MSIALLESLRRSNGVLRAALTHLQNGILTPVTPAGSGKLLAELRRAACLLRSLPADLRENGLQKEVSEYHRNLRQFGLVLPLVHERLLLHKARLEKARTHLTSAAAWADASRKTL